MHAKTTPCDEGFTLVEVLAALVVFSVSVLALSESVTGGLRTAGALENRALAGIVADNQIAMARTDPAYLLESSAVRQGETEQMGRAFEWRIEREDTQLSDFYEVTIEVSENDQLMITRRTFLARIEDTPNAPDTPTDQVTPDNPSDTPPNDLPPLEVPNDL